MITNNFGFQTDRSWITAGKHLPDSVRNRAITLFPLLAQFSPSRQCVSLGLLVITGKKTISMLSKFSQRQLSETENQELLELTSTTARLAFSVISPGTYYVFSNLFELITLISSLREQSTKQKQFLALLKIASQAITLISHCYAHPSIKEIHDIALNPDQYKDREDLTALFTNLNLWKQNSRFSLGWHTTSLLAQTVADVFNGAKEKSSVLFFLASTRSLQASANCKKLLAPSEKSLSFPTQPVDFAKATTKHLQVTLSALKFAISEELHRWILSLLDHLPSFLVLLSFVLEQRNKFPQPAQTDQSLRRFRFDDVIGCTEAKTALRKIVTLYQNLDRTRRFKAKPPKGLLFHGDPGTGKSMLAEALASELGPNSLFIAQPGSSFVEIFIGNGARTVRALFNRARTHLREKPNSCVVIFIDEIDTLGGKRSDSVGNSEHAQTQNAFLTELSEAPDGIIVIGTTNKPEILDEAFTRSGRLDRHIRFTLPTTEERRAVIQKIRTNPVFATGIPEDFWTTLEQRTEGFNYADYDNLKNQALTDTAADLTKEFVTQEILERVLDRMLAERALEE